MSSDSLFHVIGSLGAMVAVSNTVYLFITNRSRVVITPTAIRRAAGFTSISASIVNRSYREARVWRARLLAMLPNCDSWVDISADAKTPPFFFTGCDAMPHVMPARSRIELRCSTDILNLADKLKAKEIRLSLELDDRTESHGDASIITDPSTAAPIVLGPR